MMRLTKDYFTKERIAHLCLIGTVVLTLIFIFLQSLKGKDASTTDSEAVAGFLARIFSQDTPLGAFVLGNVRKIAHFCEYGLLGAECTLYLLLFVKRPAAGIAHTAAFAFFSAFVDETLQIFSGRGPQISDVWLDVLGFACLSVLTAGAFIAVKRIVQVIKERKPE